MAHLVLSDGTAFKGESFGASFDASTALSTGMRPSGAPPTCAKATAGRQNDVFGSGEVVFNTGMVGYPESLTDPSYRGQILVFTYPLIGNYGVPSEELNEYGFSRNFESEEIHVRGVICAQVSEDFSHWNAAMSFPEWLKKHNVPGITGVDTRALTKKLREHGVMLGRIAEGDANEQMQKYENAKIPDPNLRNLVAEVSCGEVITYAPAASPFETAPKGPPQGDTPTVVAYDCGMKRNIIRSFLKRGVTVMRVPWDFDLASADFRYDGIFISNGPGDPKMCTETIRQIQYAIGKEIPTFGICLGNQLMALAIGGDTYKLKYGHRGANQPCVEAGRGDKGLGTTEKREESLSPHKCIITSQNHGFAVSEDLPKGWNVWYRNANDGTVEGIRHESGKFFAVQFHPEACPGPEDAGDLFDEFLGVVGQRGDRVGL
jgi:carbamoyl-phosphate synthase small subunit